MPNIRLALPLCGWYPCLENLGTTPVMDSRLSHTEQQVVTDCDPHHVTLLMVSMSPVVETINPSERDWNTGVNLDS